MRPRTFLLSLAAILIGTLVLVGLTDSLLVDLLWFTALGYRAVFITTLGAEIAIFVLVWVVAFLAISVSGIVALYFSREAEPVRTLHPAGERVEVNLPEILRGLGGRVPWKLLVLCGAALVALFVAASESSGWQVYLKGIYGTPFALKDPAFGLNVGFFVFRLPLLEDLCELFLLILVLTGLLTIAVYWARDTFDFRKSPPRIPSRCTAHLSVLLGIFFVQRAFSYFLARYELTLHGNGVVFGLRYVDHVLWQPGLWLLAALSIVAAGICVFNLGERGLRLPVAAAIIVFGAALVLNLLQPVIEQLWVKPDQLRVETPYLTRNIALTRRAYQLDTVDVKPFEGAGELTPASLSEDSTTIKNIRLWDPRPLLTTYRQLQNIRLYYDFTSVDIDRYWWGSNENEVMLSARELNVGLLPPDAQTWINRHLKFTHGYGLVMSPVNAKDQQSLPVLYIKNIPPQSSLSIKVSQPGIYFGEEPDVYALVKARTPEFDYPRGSDNVFGFYKGTGGVPVNGLWRRLLFSLYYRDINLLVTENIEAGTRIMLRRNITGRIAAIAPYLHQDRKPYIVVHDGGLCWIIDCYTTSDHFPYSQKNIEQINYIRNSVKVVVNAYTGTTEFYVAQPEDPVLRTWERIYPGVFKPMSEMPPDLRMHIRYPQDFFLIQAEMYSTYHMTDPAVFYNREDLWAMPRENYADQTITMDPYFVIMRLPGQKTAEYILMLPMVPQGRDNMIAWLAARCDGADYGHLFEFAFSKDRLFYGPYQIQALINQNPQISQKYSLWNQMGSKVILGNLLVIPVEESLLYVEPLYIRAENGQLPQLQRVLASYGGYTVMDNDLDSSLAALFTNPNAQATIAVKSPVAPLALPANAAPSLQAAAGHYNLALQALRQGDWAALGTEIQKLGQSLGQPGESVPH